MTVMKRKNYKNYSSEQISSVKGKFGKGHIWEAKTKTGKETFENKHIWKEHLKKDDSGKDNLKKDNSENIYMKKDTCGKEEIEKGQFWKE